MKSLQEIRRPAVLFDLDGTLLPMDYDRFEKTYFAGLCKTVPEVPPRQLVAAIWEGTAAMVTNDGARTNREAFAEVFSARSGLDYFENEERFMEFYRTGFHVCADCCGLPCGSADLVRLLQWKGYLVAVATNPIFPEIATRARLQWLGLDTSEFPLVTTFDNCGFAKPNPTYYEDVCRRLGVSPADCVMVGNDVEEDGAAAALGMEVILIRDCLLNRKGLPMDGFASCTMAELGQWAEQLPAVEQ